MTPARVRRQRRMALPGTRAAPATKEAFRPPRALLGGRTRAAAPPGAPAQVSWNGLPRAAVGRPAPARTADTFRPPEPCSDPAQLRRLGVYDYRPSAVALNLCHTALRAPARAAHVARRGTGTRPAAGETTRRGLAVIDKYADRPPLWDERVAAAAQDWRPARPTLQTRPDAQRRAPAPYVHDDRRAAVGGLRAAVMRTGWRRAKHGLDAAAAREDHAAGEEVKWARLATRAVHRTTAAQKADTAQTIGWWPVQKQARDPATTNTRRIRERKKAPVVRANVTYDTWTDPSLAALIGKSERCQALLADGLPDRQVLRSMDTLKRLWATGLDAAPYTPRGVTKAPHDVPAFALGRAGGDWGTFVDEHKRDAVRRCAAR